MNSRIRRGSAMLWHRFYWLRFRLLSWTTRYSGAVTVVAVMLLAATTGILAPRLQVFLEPHFAEGNALADLRVLLVTLGGALVGATAIGFSVVVFAVQINFARMPYGLFHKLSSDHRLLSAFFGTFVLAIGVAALSIVVQESRLGTTVLAATWASVLILLLFHYAYQRALFLIDPSEQIRLLVEGARREMRAWARRARRAAPLLAYPSRGGDVSTAGATHDLPRVLYFQLNPGWTNESRRLMTYAVALAQRYAEGGDREVARIALNAVVEVNRAYVEAKGKSFFSHSIIDHPLSTDGFINESLEHLRQTMSIEVSRGDEPAMSDTLRAMTGLVHVYLSIDYSNEHANKTHALIAAGYLAAAAESVVPHAMPDVLMEGVRLMSQSAQLFLGQGRPNDMVTLIEKIARLGCTGIARENYRPVTMIAMGELADLTVRSLMTRSGDIRVAARELKKYASFIGKAFLRIPDGPVQGIHGSFLGPYYSTTSITALASRLAALAAAVEKADAADESAAAVVRNIDRWADDLNQTEKELLLEAIERRSNFTFDAIHWIASVTTTLLRMSNAPACDPRTTGTARESALSLISVLSWIPTDKETVSFVETYGVSEVLFEAAITAAGCDSESLLMSMRALLLDWACTAGSDDTGWPILNSGMCGLACVALWRDEVDPSGEIKAEIVKRLSKANTPNEERRSRSARDLREMATTLRWEDHLGSSIASAMTQVDVVRLRALLAEIAELLSPSGTGKTTPS
jgi:hypothetical protein